MFHPESYKYELKFENLKEIIKINELNEKEIKSLEEKIKIELEKPEFKPLSYEFLNQVKKINENFENKKQKLNEKFQKDLVYIIKNFNTKQNEIINQNLKNHKEYQILREILEKTYNIKDEELISKVIKEITENLIKEIDKLNKEKKEIEETLK
jgi:Mg2+ and Co2+ transporter CorA